MTEQLNLTLGSRRKICLPSFGRCDLIFFAIPEKDGLSQASSRRNHGSRRIGHGGSLIQQHQVVPCEPLQTQGGGCEVVQQSYILQVQLPCQRRGIYKPREILRVMAA